MAESDLIIEDRSHVIYTMRIFLILALVCCALSQGLTYEELQGQLLEQFSSPIVSLMFVYDGSTEVGPALKAGIEEIGQRKEGYFKILGIDCNSEDEELVKNFPYCGEDIRPKLPILFFTEPLLNPVEKGETPNPKTHNYAGTLQEKSLYNFAVPLMQLYSINLKKSVDWKQFSSKYPDTPNVIYFTDKDKISPFFKTLTAHFRSTIAFAHVFQNSSLCEQFGITEFPVLLLNGKTQIKMTGDLLEQVKILKDYEGEPTRIIIEEFKVSALNLDEDNLQEKIYENPRHILVHIPGKDGKPHDEWKKSQENFKKMFDYFETESDVLATRFGVKYRPALIYFPKSLPQKDVKKTVFHPTDNFRSIYDDISSLIEDFTIPVADDLDMQKITSMALKEGRFIAALFHRDDISLSYRVLSNDERFKNEITFIRMRDPPQDVMQKFSVKKIPSLFIMTVDENNKTEEASSEEREDGREAMNLQLAQYTGKFNYDDLQSYLSYFVKKPEESPESSSKMIQEYSSKKKFERDCFGENCYLLLVDNSPEKVQKNKDFINVFRKAMGDVYINSGFMDATCHSEVLAKLEIQAEELPVLVYLNSKFEKYSRLIGRIEEKSIETFKVKVKANKGMWRFYEKITFENKKCEKEHEMIKKQEEAGYQMSEEEAAILEEVRQEEEKRKKEAGIGIKDSRRRRKKRRPKEEDSEL